MKSVLLISFFLVSCFVNAQPSVNYWETADNSVKSVNMNSTFESNANTLPNSMLGTLLWGGYLDAAYLKDVRDQLKPTGNRFGFQFANQGFYQWQGKKHSWVAGVKYRELFGLNFSQDLFGIAFLGNGYYEGKEADLSRTNLGYWKYTGISFGISDTITKNSSFYIGASALYGLNYQSLITKEAHVYTAPEGEYVGTNGNMKLGYKEPGYGIGLAVNGNYKLKLGKNSFAFSVQDLGLMQFQNFTTYESQSDYQFKGIRINNVNTFTGDSLFSDFSGNGFAQRFNVKETKKSKLVLTPFIVTAYYSRTFNSNWRGTFDVYYTYFPAYIPKFTGRAVRSFSRQWYVSGGISYGGFGNQNLLLGAKKDFRRNWTFELESYFLGIALAPKSTKGGFGVSAGLSKGF